MKNKKVKFVVIIIAVELLAMLVYAGVKLLDTSCSYCFPKGSGVHVGCNGTGICNLCKGIGTYEGEECHFCLGSGACRECDGSGKCPHCLGTGKEK